MINLNLLNDSWLELENDPDPLVKGEYKVYSTDFKIYAGEILLALDYNENRHLLVEIPKEIKIVEDKKSQGIKFMSHILMEEDGKISVQYLDIICNFQQFNDIFSHLILEILLEVEKNPKENVNKTCLEIIEKWRQFFRRLDKDILPLSQIIGLFGELWYLKKLTELNGNTLEYWIGPDKSRFDFQYKDIALEMKTTTQSKGKFFKINGVKQLLEPKNGELYFCSLILEKKSNGITLVDLVNEILNHNIDRALFLSKLLAVGFDYSKKDDYLQHKFGIVENEDLIYKVNDLFPRIIPLTFLEGKLPPLIIDINYIIDLSGSIPEPLNEQEVNSLIIKLTS